MSKDIIVLTPNGRRQKIHCTPDTSFLQVLEDVCQKQGFQPLDYDLKHHNHLLDLSTTIRFSNLPNKATLEMVEAERKREESHVTIGLQLEDGERRTADFLPNTTLYDLVSSLAPTELNSLQLPTISYMRQEVIGESALRVKTLRHLGLIKGRAILRLLNKQEEARQANVSTVYRRPFPQKPDNKYDKSYGDKPEESKNEESSVSGPSKLSKEVQLQKLAILTKVKEAHSRDDQVIKQQKIQDKEEEGEQVEMVVPMNIESDISFHNSSHSQEHLERRLKIEEELGAQKAIAFMKPDNIEDEIEDLPDDFYDLTIEEIRRLYHDLQQQRISLENTPLISSSKREDLQMQVSQQQLNIYKNVVVRIQFPDHMILQGIFTPNNTMEDVIHFVKEHLQDPEKHFHIFTTPFKETLDPKITLFEAKFVPCVHMHFRWIEEDVSKRPCLKEDIYTRQTAFDAASILASKYRAPSRRKMEETLHSKPLASTSKSSKTPKWFKN